MSSATRNSIIVGRALLICAVSAPLAFAEPLPDFWLHENLKKAEHIVLVSEGDELDGHVVVLRSLRGKFAQGVALRLPDLAKFAEEDFPIAAPRREVLTGRMILFLKGREGELAPATEGSYACSTIWIGNRRAYTWHQDMIPGPCAVRPALSLRDERAAIESIREFDRVTPLLRDALRISDPVKRAEKLEPLLGSWFVARQAFEGIEQCGADAIEVFWAILENPDRARWHTRSVSQLVRLAGKDCASRLIRILREELPYWRRTAPKLKSQWWNGSQAARTYRYWKLRSIVDALIELEDRSARAEVRALRDLCAECPVFGNEDGLAGLKPSVDRYLEIAAKN